MNYFATFNETRFRFSKKVAYAWTSDVFTFDLSVFPQFEAVLLDAVAGNRSISITVREGEYAVTLDAEFFKTEMSSALKGTFGPDYLKSCLQKAREQLQTTQSANVLPVDEKGQIQPPANSAEFETRVYQDGTRQYCLSLRREVGRILTKLQEQKQAELVTLYAIKEFPPSTFNAKREEQKIFDDLSKVASTTDTPDSFIAKVEDYIKEQDFRFVMYDLYFGLRHFHQQVPAPSLHLFFHEIAKDEDRFPLFSYEIDIKEEDHALELRATRDHLMLNTPAINFFEFDSVLTTPRAASIDSGFDALSVIEQFIQHAFKVTEPFIVKQHYSPIASGDLPTVRYRIGLQVIKDEDRKILDYSELITDLDSAGGKNLITQIIFANFSRLRISTRSIPLSSKHPKNWSF